METFLYLLGLLLLGVGCLVGLVTLLFGLPGTFVILVTAAVYAWATGFEAVSLSTVGWLLALAVVAEVLEFVAAAAASAPGARPSRRVQVSAIVGSIIGGILGAPILFGIGALFGALAGAFAGAAIAVGSEGGSISEATAHGFAALRGRFLGFLLKTSIAVVMVILVAFAVVSPS
jgi:hypothetical protein